ncbi:MAG: hypothetical protein ACRC8A_13475 [Microcoleaceae cyanobacterium]
MDAEQIFPLIDSILPFEVCLHYQVLPLTLDQKQLCLGMVDPEDQSALDYVKRILMYQDYSVIFHRISSDDQQSVLSAYLCHTQQQSQAEPEPAAASLASPKQGNSTSAQARYTESVIASGSASAPALKLHAKHLSSPLDVLNRLPSEDLLQELLARVLLGGIGRLYFERQASVGRILWSQDGVLQSVVDDLELVRFQAIVNELKRFAGIALAPVEEPKQVELERTYRGKHLLLRLRLVPGKYGEEINLQVLRGAALRFYQQQQLALLSQDALKLAQQLQRKLSEISDRIVLAPVPSENLPLLNQLLKTLTQQTESIIQQNGAPRADKS